MAPTTTSVKSIWAVTLVSFPGRHNYRSHDTIDMMGSIARGMNGKRLMYRELVGN